MLLFIVHALLFILFGAGVIVATGLTLAYLIAKSNEHDQERCSCWDCQNRRTKSLEKAKAKEAKKNRFREVASEAPARDPKDYWATSELATGRHVIVKGAVYRVTGLYTLPDGNTKVGLQNILTEIHTMIIITRDMHEIKIWRKGMEMDIW